jgi:hypothetical protein
VDVYVLDERHGAHELSKTLGKRPDKTVDAEYLRRSPFGGKWMFWDAAAGKYVHVRSGAKFRLVPGQAPELVS